MGRLLRCVQPRGVGTELYRALLADLRTRDFHTVIGGVALPNPVSVALHEKLSFTKVAQFAEVGYKLGRWVDVRYYNRRTDEYGGSFDNRIRFLLEIIRAIRERIGRGVPLGVRLNGDDFIPQGGWRLPEVCRLAPIRDREAVDYVNISAGATSMGTLHYTIMPMYQEQGVFAPFSEEVKRYVSIPVILTGRIKSPVVADGIIKEGRADLEVMSRAQIADPELVEKASQGRLADIRPCLAECLGCIEGILRYGEASCAVNARLGREYLLEEIEGEKKAAAKRVLVAGAGCAGLEAARRAAFAGHKVILCESRSWIGGQLRLAAMMPKRQEIGDIIPWYERQLHRLGVEIRLNTTVDEGLLDEIGPDVLVLACGSLPEVPLGFIDGLGNVRDIELVMADELVGEGRLTGEAVLVIGGDQIGLQVADHLSQDGKTVYVVEKGDHFGQKMASNDRRFLMGRLIAQGVKRYKNVEKVDLLEVRQVHAPSLGWPSVHSTKGGDYYSNSRSSAKAARRSAKRARPISAPGASEANRK